MLDSRTKKMLKSKGRGWTKCTKGTYTRIHVLNTPQFNRHV